MLSKSPCCFLNTCKEQEILEDPCAGLPEFSAYYQCGITAVHRDQVPWRGQCKTISRTGGDDKCTFGSLSQS
jgi:hypothetical protein